MALMFRRREFPLVGGRRKGEYTNNGRGKREDYDHVWEDLSVRFRRKNPFCRFCEQEGFECVPVDDVDHIIPLEDGGARLDRNNLQSSCRKHHNGLKSRLQRYARAIGRIDLLPLWCADPSTRPDMTARPGTWRDEPPTRN